MYDDVSQKGCAWGGGGAGLLKEQIGTEGMIRRKNQKCFGFSNYIAPDKNAFFSQKLESF